MNIKKSIRVALAERDKNMAWLTDQLDVSRARTSKIANAEALNSKSLERLSKIFGLSVSEFIALGEREPREF